MGKNRSTAPRKSVTLSTTCTSTGIVWTTDDIARSASVDFEGVLRPCPFCGCTKVGIKPGGAYDGGGVAFCTNHDCDAEGPYDPEADEEGLAELWNQRAPSYLCWPVIYTTTKSEDS